MNTIFDRYHLDVTRTGGTEVRKAFELTGLITFECDTREEFKNVIGRLGEVVPHRDSEPDGVTVIEYKAELADAIGYRAMGSWSLDLHTDSSGLPKPPRGVGLLCEKSAGDGGDAILVDGRALYEELCAEDPVSAQVLRTPGTAVFCSGDTSVRSPIFDVSEQGAVRVRVRFDDLGFFPLRMLPHLSTLQRHAISNVMSLPLLPGQGYMLDNSRYLHGRRSFNGARRMLRLLFDLRDS